MHCGVLIVVPQLRTQASFAGYCRAIYDFAATAPNQISFREGDRIKIINKGGELRGWWKGRKDSQVGAIGYLTFEF